MGYYTLAETLAELKHSVYTHVTLQAGPSPQLSAFLVKLLDTTDDLCGIIDGKQDREVALKRINEECALLAFHVIEALAVWLQRVVDDRKAKARSRGENFPENVQHCSDGLMVLVGRTRSFPDKLAAKNAVLRGIAEVLRALQTYTKSTYPEIRDVKNNLL